MAALRNETRREMTVEKFLDWPGGGLGTKFQPVHGLPKAMAPARAERCMIHSNLVVGPGDTPHLHALGLDIPVAHIDRQTLLETDAQGSEG